VAQPDNRGYAAAINVGLERTHNAPAVLVLNPIWPLGAGSIPRLLAASRDGASGSLFPRSGRRMAPSSDRSDENPRLAAPWARPSWAAESQAYSRVSLKRSAMTARISSAMKWLYATKRGWWPLIRATGGVCLSTPQWSSSRRR
jgi:GT2 family glycosyltransferase